jgi:hypothetical protein
LTLQTKKIRSHSQCDGLDFFGRKKSNNISKFHNIYKMKAQKQYKIISKIPQVWRYTVDFRGGVISDNNQPNRQSVSYNVQPYDLNYLSQILNCICSA